LCNAVEAPVADEVSHLGIVFFYLSVVSKCIYRLEVYDCTPRCVRP
jgi:hypothetical protein